MQWEDSYTMLVSEFGDKALAPTGEFRGAVRVRSRELQMRMRYSM